MLHLHTHTKRPLDKYAFMQQTLTNTKMNLNNIRTQAEKPVKTLLCTHKYTLYADTVRIHTYEQYIHMDQTNANMCVHTHTYICRTQLKTNKLKSVRQRHMLCVKHVFLQYIGQRINIRVLSYKALRLND